MKGKNGNHQKKLAENLLKTILVDWLTSSIEGIAWYDQSRIILKEEYATCSRSLKREERVYINMW